MTGRICLWDSRDALHSISVQNFFACDVMLDVYRQIKSVPQINLFNKLTLKDNANSRLFLYLRVSVSKSFVKMSDNQTVSQKVSKRAVWVTLAMRSIIARNTRNWCIGSAVNTVSSWQNTSKARTGKRSEERNCCNCIWRLHDNYIAIFYFVSFCDLVFCDSINSFLTSFGES